MKQSIRYAAVFVFAFGLSFFSFGQSLDSQIPAGLGFDADAGRLVSFIRSLNGFSRQIPREKVYLHFDNTSYYRQDSIWFKCYVVSGDNRLSDLSRTLYVELLNPGGGIVDRRILKVEDGRCHGEFALNHVPFYSGFYEVRAYTKYMLNFGEEAIYSRLLPVFDAPKSAGDFEDRSMLSYGRRGPEGNYPMRREAPERQNAVNLRFYPEGGNLVRGVESRVAFEATDEAGNPIEVSGFVSDENGRELAKLATLHEGKGMFVCTPGSGIQTAVVEYSGRTYRFDLPAALARGVVMEVDNLSRADSIVITLRKGADTPAQLFGAVLLSGGRMRDHILAWLGDYEQVGFRMDKTRLPAGVSRIVLFDVEGAIVCDRLIFTGGGNTVAIRARADRPAYDPLEPVDMEFSVTDGSDNPVNTTFSLAIRDGWSEVESRGNILSDLLLMSEIRGYVRDPLWYFEGYNDPREGNVNPGSHPEWSEAESKDLSDLRDSSAVLGMTTGRDGNASERADNADAQSRRAALDLLLMVQGWRRYSFGQMAGTEPFEPEYLPEQGIEVSGRVVSLARQLPQPGVDLSILLLRRGEEEDSDAGFFDTFLTDEQGRFSVALDTYGRWNMTLGVTQNGRARDHLVMLNRLFSPEARRYGYAELQTSIVGRSAEMVTETVIEVVTEEAAAAGSESVEDPEPLSAAPQDPHSGQSITERLHSIPEVTVTARQRVRERNIASNRATSVAYYDVHSELDDIYDRGVFIGDDIHQMLVNMDPNFEIRLSQPQKFSVQGPTTLFANAPSGSDDTRGSGGSIYDVLYKGKKPLYVMNYKRVDDTQLPIGLLRLQAIKSIYINEDLPVMMQYAPAEMNLFAVAATYSCAVFIETYPEDEVPVEAARGIRKTWLDGYSAVKEFYSPDYSAQQPLPSQPDYRRTLYWNPSVAPDEDGIARVSFYNNSRRRTSFTISAETITTLGEIGVYK